MTEQNLYWQTVAVVIFICLLACLRFVYVYGKKAYDEANPKYGKQIDKSKICAGCHISAVICGNMKEREKESTSKSKSSD